MLENERNRAECEKLLETQNLGEIREVAKKLQSNLWKALIKLVPKEIEENAFVDVVCKRGGAGGGGNSPRGKANKVLVWEMNGWRTTQSFLFLFSNKWLNKLMRRFYWSVSSKSTFSIGILRPGVNFIKLYKCNYV